MIATHVFDPTSLPQLGIEIAAVLVIGLVVWVIDIRHAAVVRRRAEAMKRASHIQLFTGSRVDAGHDAWASSDHRGANR